MGQAALGFPEGYGGWEVGTGLPAPPNHRLGVNKADLTAVKEGRDRQGQRREKRERKIAPHQPRSPCVIRVSRKL